MVTPSVPPRAPPRAPTLTIVAGPNGAGKSTLTAGNVDIFGAAPVLDPDSFSNILHPRRTATASIGAGKEVVRLARKHLERRESFAVETTLSGKNSLEMMVSARTQGFEIVLV